MVPCVYRENHKNIGFLRNTGVDTLENHKATKRAFNVGPSNQTNDSGKHILIFQWKSNSSDGWCIIYRGSNTRSHVL